MFHLKSTRKKPKKEHYKIAKQIEPGKPLFFIRILVLFRAAKKEQCWNNNNINIINITVLLVI
jgi:hypothetical protein